MRASLGCFRKGSILRDEMSKSDAISYADRGAPSQRPARNVVVSDAEIALFRSRPLLLVSPHFDDACF